MNMFGNMGAALFPVTAGWLVARTGNWNLILFLFAAVMAIDALCWALLNPRGTLFGDDHECGDEHERSSDTSGRCRAAIARCDITPPVGIYHRMWGAALHDRATGVHRPLEATLLWLEPCEPGPASRRSSWPWTTAFWMLTRFGASGNRFRLRPMSPARISW